MVDVPPVDLVYSFSSRTGDCKLIPCQSSAAHLASFCSTNLEHVDEKRQKGKKIRRYIPFVILVLSVGSCKLVIKC